MTPSYARGAIERHLTSRPPEFPGNSMGSQCAHWTEPFGHPLGSAAAGGLMSRENEPDGENRRDGLPSEFGPGLK